jgi:3-oxoacyl-[acyl-carrier protein] reductase
MSDAQSPFGLAGRAAVVTGAASGIGRASAAALAAAGARVALADVDEAGLAESAASIDGSTLVVRTDVSKRGEVDALVARAVAAFGRLDVMANVAGILHERAVVDVSEADLDRVLAVNLKGVFFGCQAAARVMAAQRAGSIVNVASSAAFEPYPTLSAYSMSKAGVVALTRVLAAELGPAGVRVNAVAPGAVETPMGLARARNPDGSIDPERREALRAFVRSRNPLGIGGQPEDIGWAIVYLASDAARYMTGQVLHPNGGRPMV